MDGWICYVFPRATIPFSLVLAVVNGRRDKHLASPEWRVTVIVISIDGRAMGLGS